MRCAEVEQVRIRVHWRLLHDGHRVHPAGMSLALHPDVVHAAQSRLLVPLRYFMVDHSICTRRPIHLTQPRHGQRTLCYRGEEHDQRFHVLVETQYTTGYGSRTPSTACPEAVFLLCVQNIIGMLLQSCSLGIIYAKLARPKARSQAIKFSEKSVISMRDGYLCLMFRIADMRKSHVIGCEVKGWVLRNKWTARGRTINGVPFQVDSFDR
uniref:ATP-sensitive inward rectifier potassium channel 12 n=1 Tax=Lygus hesperus TaxID=30085 RepID=A0A0A9XBX1_LYGHE